MINTIQYTGEFKPVEVSIRKLDNIADYWIRRNAREDHDQDGNTISIADEIHLIVPLTEESELLTKEEIESDIDKWFVKEAEKETTMDDIIEAINELASIVLGGD